MNGGLGCIRCTGRYDNRSFIIKTPYLYIPHMSLFRVFVVVHLKYIMIFIIIFSYIYIF